MGLTGRDVPVFLARLVIFLAGSGVMARSALAAPVGISARGACEAALALEANDPGKAASRAPCHSAFIVDGAPQDMRNEVASLMSPAAHPSLDDLVIGSLISDAAVRKAPDQPWGYLARCDIARRLGSADLLEACLADLRRVAPAHAATKQALTYAGERAPLATWILRALLALGLLGTLAHALARRRRATRRLPAPLATALLAGIVALSALAASTARAEPTPGRDQLSEFKIDDANPEASIPSVEIQNRKPLEFGYYLQDLAAKAESAAKSGDHTAEARYYNALSKAAPTASFGPRKLCQVLETAGDIPGAIVACRTTLTREGSTVGDYLHFVRVVLATPGALPSGEQAELDAVINHLLAEAKLGAVPIVLRCEVALRFADAKALAACTDILRQIAPNDPKTVSFEWALALQRHDRSAALQLVDRARGVGMSKEGVAKMEEATRQMNRRYLARLALMLLGAALVAALLALGFRRLSLRRRLAI